jgi:MSHA biogenesis protein MshQ
LGIGKVKRTNRWLSALGLIAMTSFAQSAWAATCTSKASGNWGTASTWTCTAGTVPASGDTVILASPFTVTLNVAATITNLTVNPGSTLTLTSTPLTVTGNIANDGTITGAGSQIVQSTGAAAIISGAGTFAGSSRLYFSGATPSIAAGANLTFAGTATIRAGRNGGTVVPGSVLTINGTLTSTQAAGTNLLRLYSNSTVIGATGVINAATSTITYQSTTATVTNNGSVSVTSIAQNATTNSWTQGNNSSLTVTAASTVGTLYASANGNTVTYTSPATPITPNLNTYYNLAGTGVPCPTTFIILGTSPCTLPSGVISVTRSPTLCTNVAGIGTVAWTGLANALASDNVYTTAINVIRNVTTNYLQCTGYGFAIPAGSTILGITVNVERKTSGGTIRDAAMRTVKAGVIGTTDRSTVTNYTTTDFTAAHGGSTDLWGGTWATTDINAATFGAAFASMNATTSTTKRTVSVDYMPVTVYYTTPSIHHIEIDHPGSGSTCTPTSVTVIACGDAACTAGNLYTLGTSVTLTPGGGVATVGATGVGSGTVASPGTAGTFILAATSSPAAANATICRNTVSGATSCSFTFNSSAISLAVPNGVSGSNVTGTISACTGSAYTGNKTINFYTTYANPTTGTKQVSINGTAIGTTAATSTPITLNFVSSSATFTLAYPDVALVDLTASYTGTPALSNGVDSFIMKPAGFVLSNIKRTNDGAVNPGATTAGGAAFVKAGEAFSVTVTAVNSAGVATPNFGRATPPEGVQLTSVLVGGLGLTSNPAVDRRTTGSILSGSSSLTVTNSNGYAIGDRLRVAGAGVAGADLFTTITAIAPGGIFTLANAASTGVSVGQVQYTFSAFSGGVATGTNFTWDEVGIITLMPSVADASYMTTGNVIGDRAGNPSGPVGRFTLAKLNLQPQLQDDRADICNGGFLISDGVTPCPGFTYMGEEFDANFTLMPMSLNNVAIQNYVGQNGASDFAKLDPTVFASLRLAAVDRTTAGQPYYLGPRISNAGMPVATCNTTPCFTLVGTQAVANIAVPLTLSRNATPDGAYTAVNIGIAPLDADNAPVDAVGTAGTGTCNNTTLPACYDMDSDAVAGNDHALVATTEFRYGRINISNTYGSELLGLVLPIAIEYWNGGAYVKSANDVGTVAAIALGTYHGNLTAGMTTATLSALSGGVGRISLTAPGANHNGSVDVTAPVPAYLPSNTGRATFGVYQGRKEFIYMRENY